MPCVFFFVMIQAILGPASDRVHCCPSNKS